MLRRLNDALPGLVAGIVIYGIICQLLGMWFVEDKWGYSIGLWYGIVIAIGMAINLASVIYDSVTLGDIKGANRRIIAKSILRYVVVVILFMILGFLEFGNLFSALLGVLGLKISAYAQPVFIRVTNRILGRSDASSLEGEDSFAAEDAASDFEK